MGSNRLNVYLSEQDQRDLAVIAYILADDGYDGTVDNDLSINRSATLQILIRCFKAAALLRKDLKWKEVEQYLLSKGVFRGESGDDLSG